MWNLSCILILERLAVYLYSVLCTLSMHTTALSISPRIFHMPQKDARRQWMRWMRRGLSLPEGPAALSDRGKAALDPDKLVDHFSFRGAKRGQALAKESQHSSILHLHRQPTSAVRFNFCRRKTPKMAEMDINCRWRCMAGHGRPAHPSLTLPSFPQFYCSANGRPAQSITQ
ncbi:hypothetical protein BDW60DRAFT_15660 [Aspergillus nidulans var. acristatus]